MRLRTTLAIVTVMSGLTLALLGTAFGQQIHRNDFEANEVGWTQNGANAPFKELAHEITGDSSHTGQRSEHIQLQVETGSFIYYSYDLGKAPLTDELNASVWVKGSRAGIQLMARLVLPHERGDNPASPLTTLLRDDSGPTGPKDKEATGPSIYQSVGRWQRLELGRPVKLAKQQQQLLRADLKRDVDLTDAYIDKLILNVYAGPGPTELWIDDLEAGPVTDAKPFQVASRPVTKDGPLVSKDQRPDGLVKLEGEKLMVGGKPVFFVSIRYSDTPLKVLREARFNTIWFDEGTPLDKINEAANLGFHVVASVPYRSADAAGGPPPTLGQTMAGFDKLHPLFLCMGSGGLALEHEPQVASAVQVIRSIDDSIPLAADVWDGYQPYSRDVKMLGVHRWPLLTSLELLQYRDWLTQRRILASYPRGENKFMWTWIQTHLPDWYTTLVYNRPGAASFSEAIGPQPEHIRLLTYIALGSGCKGLGYWSDRFLADSHQGRDRLLGMALLNMELQMIEPLLVSTQTPVWIDTSIPEVKAAVFYPQSGGQGILVLPVWLGSGSQFVPGQAAVANLSIVIPQVPTSAQPWEVSAGEVRSLHHERVSGGTKVTLPEFGLSAAVVLTADNGPSGLLVRLQSQAKRTAKLAAQWGHDLAEEELRKVAAVNTDLEQAGHKLPDGKELLQSAQKRLQSSVELWNGGNYREAFAESERTLRPVRILMRAQWEAATKELDAPVASPYAVSFFTLPRHWQFMNQIKQGTPGPNALPGGDFETPPDRSPDAWILQEPQPLDRVQLSAKRVTTNAKQGKQCLELKIQPRDPIATNSTAPPPPPPAALERTFLAVSSPTVQLTPGTPVRISGWIRIPQAITASVDGALIYDSAGGEPLAVRMTNATGWKQVTLYRIVPSNGQINVTLALTGLGTAYFDDVRIEPLVSKSPVASAPRQ